MSINSTSCFWLCWTAKGLNIFLNIERSFWIKVAYNLSDMYFCSVGALTHPPTTSVIVNSLQNRVTPLGNCPPPPFKNCCTGTTLIRSVRVLTEYSFSALSLTFTILRSNVLGIDMSVCHEYNYISYYTNVVSIVSTLQCRWIYS